MHPRFKTTSPLSCISCRATEMSRRLSLSSSARRVRFEKAGDALPQVDRGRVPQPPLLALALCGDDVQQVQSENQILVGEHHDFRFVEGHDVARGYSCETTGVMLIKTKDVLRLKNVGSLYELGEHIAMIGGGGRHFERSLHQKA